MDSIGSWLDNLADTYAQQPALISLDEQVTYRELADAAAGVAKGLAVLGVSKGTRVGLLMPNRADWLAGAFGALKLGAVVVPLNTLWKQAELEYGLRHADVAVLLLVPRFLNHGYADMLTDLCPELARTPPPLLSRRLPALRHVVAFGESVVLGIQNQSDFLARGATVDDQWFREAQGQVALADHATIFFTSGTTAEPKGVVHTHDSMLQATANVADRLGLCESDRTWGYLPFFFTGGLVAVAMATLSRGGAVLLQEVFDAGMTLELMARHACTTFFAWPHQAQALIGHPQFAGAKLRLRKGPGANAPWADRLFERGHQAVGTWGMTETGPMASSTRFDDPLSVRAGAHGRPMPGLEFRIVNSETGVEVPAGDEGELLVRGSSLMSHYYKLSPAECFDVEGYFHTGDLAKIDADGLLHFLGRLKDVIKTAGVNVAAAEVEAVLNEHPQVRVAYVTGVPHAARGENVAAFVVPRDPSCTTDVLLDFCKARLASYKVPRHIVWCRENDLPQLGSGKVDKRALRQLALARVGERNA